MSLSPSDEMSDLQVRFAEAELSISKRFEQLAFLHSDRKAIASGEWQPTYAELNKAADRVARFLLKKHCGKGDRVAVLMQHDAPLFAVVLGILKAGKVVVALNPTDPPERLRQIQSDSEPALLVTDSLYATLAGSIASSGQSLIRFENFAEDSAETLVADILPGDVAFLLYTSGSTGKPKGVVQTHRNLVRNAFVLGTGMEVRPEDRIVLPATLSGGLGVATCWCALLNGATLCLFPAMERGVVGFAEWLEEHQITGYVSAASVFRRLVKTLAQDQRLSTVRWIRLAAETASHEDIESFRQHFSDGCVLYHSLSSSETGNIAQYRISKGAKRCDGPLPAGRPAPGIELLLLDESGNEVASGTAGEMWIRSRFLSPGYWKNDALTRECFLDTNVEGVRLFRTGDLGRFTDDGLLVHLGRKDAQVKIRGFRVELSEIEGWLARQKEIETAAICAMTEHGADARLNAYIVLRDQATTTADDLRSAMLSVLPAYMVPGAFVFLKQMPLTAQGKVDREKLRRISPDMPAISAGEPLSTTENLVAKVWRKVFPKAEIGRTSNFFELGGDSLNAAVVTAEIRAAVGIELELRTLFQRPNLAVFASWLDTLPRAAELPQARFAQRNLSEPFPLSFAQERIWKFSQTPEGAAAYTIACSYRICGVLNSDLLQESVNELVRRHEMLRTTFSESAGEPLQRVHAAGTIPLERAALPDGADVAVAIRKLLHEQALKSFDVSRLPLMRLTLVRIREDEHWLLQTSHHIISDGWSWKLFFNEMASVYNARLQGKPSSLPEIETGIFSDSVARERELFHPQSQIVQSEIDWWRDRLKYSGKRFRLPFRRIFRNHEAPAERGILFWGVEANVSERLNRIGRDECVTYFVVRLAAFAAFLTAKKRVSHLTLGTYVSLRNRVELQSLFGYFSNLAVLRIPCNRNWSFRIWLKQVAEAVSETQAHGEIPFELLSEELRRGEAKFPTIDAIFSVAGHTSPVRLGEAELAWIERITTVMPWSFTLSFDQNNEHRRCNTMFDARVYDPKRVRRWIEGFVQFLDRVSRDLDSPVRGLR